MTSVKIGSLRSREVEIRAASSPFVLRLSHLIFDRLTLAPQDEDGELKRCDDPGAHNFDACAHADRPRKLPGKSAGPWRLMSMQKEFTI